MSLPQRLLDVVGAFPDFPENSCPDTVPLEKARRSLGRLDVKTEVIEPPDERECLLLIPVADGDKDRSVVVQFHTGRLQRLIESAVNPVVVADGFSGRLHFRRKRGVHTGNLAERKYRDLDVPALFLLRVDRENAKLLERFSENDLRCDVGKAVTGRFGQKRHGARGARIDLDDIHGIVLIYDKLDVE